MRLTEATLVDSFNQCLIETPTSLGYCLGVGALSKLQSIDNDPEYDFVDGVTFARDEQQVRENYNFLDRNPADFRTIVDSIGYVFSRRSMHWDMSVLYPGLAMRVAPSGSPGGVLEFVLDTHREALSEHSLKESGTGRLIARQFLLPFLLGFKFNIATLIPIIFGTIAFIAKKIILISKVGLIISSVITLGSLLFKKEHYSHHGGYHPSFSGHYGHAPYNRYPDDDDYYQTHILRNLNDNQVGNIFNNIQEVHSRESLPKNGKRNFAWNEDEKKKKQ
ncbi:hypothetical protein RN001_011985 [Aquatica leii]|uniref:Osiris 10 n=1 Tax=Aquatica leii TaxID=1421715 RepID=A0AAN7SM95_9COLE|nr:hypothetical protein RN001_011985 [Aquatica leii]